MAVTDATHRALGLEKSGGSPIPPFAFSASQGAVQAVEPRGSRVSRRLQQNTAETHRVHIEHTQFISHTSIHTLQVTQFTHTNTHETRTQAAFTRRVRFQPTHLPSWTVPSFLCAYALRQADDLCQNSITPVFQFNVSFNVSNSSAGD